jgi:hypothetical protein
MEITGINALLFMLFLGVIVCYSIEITWNQFISFFLLLLGVIDFYSIEITGANIYLWLGVATITCEEKNGTQVDKGGAFFKLNLM